MPEAVKSKIFFVLKYDSVGNTKMATLEIPVAQFEGDLIYDEWFNMTPAGKCKKGGRSRVQVSLLEVSAFHSQRFQTHHYPRANKWSLSSTELRLPAFQSWIQVQVTNIAFLSLEDNRHEHPNPARKSCIIDNTLHPRWNQIFRVSALSLNSSQFRLQMMDHDKFSKDDKISHFIEDS